MVEEEEDVSQVAHEDGVGINVMLLSPMPHVGNNAQLVQLTWLGYKEEWGQGLQGHALGERQQEL